MKNIWILIIGILMVLVVTILTGIFVYQRYNTSDSNIVENKQLAQQNIPISYNEDIMPTSYNENDNISPNASVIQKQYYHKCDHLIKSTQEIPDILINKSEKDVKEYYDNWRIEKYSPTEIIIYKEYEGICQEHYILKEHNGVIGIYNLNSEGIEEFKEDTAIQTMYLPEIDLQKLAQGIKVTGKEQLNSVLEDFE